jgi:hypothetical protein
MGMSKILRIGREERAKLKRQVESRKPSKRGNKRYMLGKAFDSDRITKIVAPDCFWRTEQTIKEEVD